LGGAFKPQRPILGRGSSFSGSAGPTVAQPKKKNPVGAVWLPGPHVGAKKPFTCSATLQGSGAVEVALPRRTVTALALGGFAEAGL